MSIKRTIQCERERYQPILNGLVESGDYFAERELRSRLNKIVDELQREWVHVRQCMPPFVTDENGILHKHPVTPENAHLLRPWAVQ